MRLAAVPSCVGNKGWKKIENKSVPVFREGLVKQKLHQTAFFEEDHRQQLSLKKT